ncbi:hypothetical protein DCC39_16090 [Pueribacillus theae]|uniref:Uncharacterized protein n=1 Tax=Pueribacillus theae TaxID=2171751 RepID=A0A2U1JRJ4_9BACI|nr:hypothetical protein [Pueribacillus theae]PWA07816.1 hypothetical protein DCC39_16090 [Pueribacillus theae]
MYKYNVISFIFLISYVLIYCIRGPSLWLYGFFGKLEVVLLILLPLFGTAFAFKSKGWSKWVLIILNLIAFLYIFLTLSVLIAYKYFGDFAP